MLPTLGRQFADVSASMYAVYAVMNRRRASPSGISICSMRGRVNLFPIMEQKSSLGCSFIFVLK